MTRAEVEDLFRYTAWANARMLDAAAVLSGEQYIRDLGNSFRSVRDTIVHIMSGEWVWLSRWQGVSPTSFPADWTQLDVAGVRSQWREIEDVRAAFVDSLDERTLTQPRAYRSFAGVDYAEPLEHQIRHLVNHSTYHRGQVATMLRQLGAGAPTTDLIAYYRERTVHVYGAR